MRKRIFVLLAIMTIFSLTFWGMAGEGLQVEIKEGSNTNSDSQGGKSYAPQSVDDLQWKNISNFLTQSYLKDDLEFMTEQDKKFQFYQIDLNEDGHEEYFVYLVSPYFCGTGGCTVLLLDRYSELITRFTVMEPPIYVSQETTNGWRDLLVYSEGAYRDLIFDSSTYPSNPSVAPESSNKPDGNYEVLFDEENHPDKTYSFYETEELTSTDESLHDQELRSKLLSNTILTVPETEEEVTLTEGMAEWSLGYLRLGEKFTILPAGEIIGILEVNSGGNAEDIYLAAFEPDQDVWYMTDALLLGDYASNADVSELYFNGDTIYVTYYTYGEGMQAQAEEKTVENRGMYNYLMDGRLINLSRAESKGEDILPDLAGTSWMWERTNMNDDTTYIPKEGEFVLTFADYSTFTSTTDCNTIQGGYGYNAAIGQIIFEDFIQTFKLCPDSLEDQYISGLQNSEMIYIEDDTLYLQIRLDGGSMIFSRVKK